MSAARKQQTQHVHEKLAAANSVQLSIGCGLPAACSRLTLQLFRIDILIRPQHLESIDVDFHGARESDALQPTAAMRSPREASEARQNLSARRGIQLARRGN